MAMPSSGQCYTAIVTVFLVLVVGLLYTSYAFRIRDHAIPTNLETCTSGRCLTPKRGFETVSTRGGFVNSKLQPPDEIGELKKRDKLKLWSKLNKVESIGDNGDGEDIDSDDEIVQIEVEDDDGIIVIDEREKLILNEKKEKEDLQKEEKKRKEKEENDRREKEEELRRQREEEKRLKKEKEDRRKKEEEERLKRVEEERRKKEEDERIKKQEEEQHIKEEAEQSRKQKEEQRKKEAEEERLREEQRKIEEEERLKEEERRKKEEEERRKKEEEERLQEEEECRLKEEELERKKQEEEQLRKEREERKLKEKQEADRKRDEKLALEADKRRKEEENKKRVQSLKKDAEQQKLREMEEKKKRSQTKNDDNDDDNGDDEKVPLKNQKKIEQIKLVSKTKAKPKLKTDNQLKTQFTKKSSSNTSKPKSNENTNSASLSLAELNDMILSVPTFMPNFTAVEDPVCQQHGKIFLRQLRGYKLWALQMLDSSAKIPSGLLRGNVNQLGDFDQCLEVLARVKIDEKTIKVQGKYCLASMDIYAMHSAAKLPVNLIQGRTLIRGNMRDPGHFVPKFTTVNWALCLPAACSAKDARKSIENALDSYNMTVGMKFMVDVYPEMCYVKQRVQSYSKETIGALYFFAFIICLTIAATLRDYLATLHERGSYSERIIMSFSLKRTVKALFSNIETSPSDIGCIHGIRSLATIALYAAHKLIPMSRMPYANRISLTETANHPLSTVLRSSLVYTDSFLLLSGVLTAYNMAKELETRGEIRWFCRLIARYVRLTPCLLAIVFWYAYVMEHIGSGPQWNAVVKSNADICKESSWINLLYVQNYFPFEEMCATHTHQLALDMQLFLIAPALVFFLQIKPILGIIIVFFLLQVSATLRYLATSNNNLSLVIFHGMTLKHLYKTANLTYALPLHRATPYLFGVSLGVLLHCAGKKLRMHKILALLGWLIALALGSWSLFSPWRLARRDYTYNVEEATYYAVVSPILTALALCYIIFACFTHNGGIVNRILSSYWMVVFSRLSYAIYLSQFAVFFYNVGTARYGSDFQPLRTIDPHEAIIVMSVSVVLTLLFDIPMQEVKNIIMECSDTLAEIEAEKAVESNAQPGIRNNVHKIPQDITPDEEEPAPGGWNWNRGTFTKSTRPESREYEENGIEEYRSSRLKRQDIRRQSMIRSEAYDEWDNRNISRRTSRSEDDGRTSRSNYRLSDAGVDDLPLESYLHPRERYYSGGYSRSPIRDLDAPVFRRSVSRDRPLSKDQDIPNEYSRRPLITISKEEDYQSSRSPRPSMSRFNDQQRSLSSESEDPMSSRRNSGNYGRRLSTEPRVADDDEWEEELRIRRSRFLQERVNSQERERIPPAVEEEEENSQWNSLKRRSSAEGKMALLKEPFRPGNMELWTVSKMALGSSQEPDEEDEEMYLQQRREYREQEPPLREELEGEEDDSSRRRSFASESLPTSFDEEEEVTNSNEFALTKSTRNLHITVQDLSKLSHEDDTTINNNWNKLDVKSGLFKRESIVKSQASEEDPEYLLPERPKLIEQEQEHPFKKAWQMQKSRSEEEGSSVFIVKEQTKMSPPLDKQYEEPEGKSENEKADQTGEQGNEIPEPDVTCEVTLVWQPRNNDIEDTRSSSKSIASSVSSAHINWPDEEEQFQNYRNRRKSDEESWMWTEKDT